MISSDPITPMHQSMVGRKRTPMGFGEQAVTPEQRIALETVAADTFTRMVNKGHTFQAALSAVYYSGIVHALEMQ